MSKAYLETWTWNEQHDLVTSGGPFARDDSWSVADVRDEKDGPSSPPPLRSCGRS